MGLDQFAFYGEDNEYAYWRKHNRLQGWFEENYQIENCGEVYLTTEIINLLEEDIKNNKLPETTGFFYGGDSYEDYEGYYKDIDLKFIDDTRRLLSEGKKPYYTCWF